MTQLPVFYAFIILYTRTYTCSGGGGGGGNVHMVFFTIVTLVSFFSILFLLPS